MRRISVLSILLFSILYICVEAFCEETQPPPPPTCQGAAEFAFVATTGNTSTQTLGLAGSIECKPAPWGYLAKAAFIRSEANDVENAKSIDTLFRVSRDLSTRLKTYGQFIYYENQFAGIDNRYALEGGLSYLLVTTQKHSLQAEGGFGYTHENRVTLLGVPDDDLSFATARLGAIYRWKLSENAEIGDDAGFTFNLSDGSDWRFANLAYVAAKLTTVFSLKLSYGLNYLNTPVLGFGKTDTVTSAAVVAKF